VGCGSVVDTQCFFFQEFFSQIYIEYKFVYNENCSELEMWSECTSIEDQYNQISAELRSRLDEQCWRKTGARFK
jgi:hypothetical protein